MLPISASVERSASENLVRRFGGEMPTASSPHDGVKGAVFPSLVRAPRVAFRKSPTPPPMGGCMALPRQPVAEGLGRNCSLSAEHRTRSRFPAQAEKCQH